MVFPQTPLSIKVELYINGVWTDVTSDVRSADQIRITRGRSDEGQIVDTTRCSFTLDNNDGRYSPRNPTGVYYGYIGRNTPCRVSVLAGDVFLELPSTLTTSDYAETPDAAALDVTGDIDVRIDMTLANWMSSTTSTDTVELFAKLATSQKSWMLAMRSGRLYFEWSADGTNSLSASSTIAPPIMGSGRLAVRATLDVDNGSGGKTVTFFTSDTIDGVWVQLGDPVTTVGTTSIFNSTTPVRIGNASAFAFDMGIGRVYSAQIYNGIWGTQVANPYFSAQAVGTTSFADAAGRTWSMVGQAQITNRKTRFLGEISSWPVRWETKFDVVVPVEASGIMRRLQQGASPVRSAIYREFTNPARTSIVAYWPCEDGVTATAFASALDDGQAMVVSPTGVTPAAYSEWAASDAMATYTSGRARGRVPSYTPTNYSYHRFFAAVPSGGVATTQRLYSFSTTGTSRTWSLFVNSAGSLDLRAYNSAGTQILATGFIATALNGKKAHVGVQLTQNGANIDYSMLVFDIDASTLTTSAPLGTTGTLAATTFGVCTEIRVGQDGDMGGTALGHFAVGNDSAAFSNTLKAMVAYQGEEAVTRMYRLGEEEQLPVYPVIEGVQRMGTQGLSTLLDLLREAEAVDGGILTEGRNFLGFRYRDYQSLLNQVPSLVLDYTGSDGLVTPLDPVDDDQQVRNDITVERTSGASARVTLDTGTLSTLAPPLGVGRYDESVSLHLFDDSQPLNIAGWKLHLGTWNEMRVPVAKVMLSKAVSSIDEACDADVGNLVRINNPPSWLPPDAINLMVQGYTETFDQFTWDIEYNCTPSGPWTVAWTGDDDAASAAREFTWLDTAGSVLAEDLTTTESGVDIYTTTEPVWTSDPQDSPYDLVVGGEVMTVTGPGALINDNPFFDSNTTSWAGTNMTLTRSTTYVVPHPRALASLRCVPDGVTATVSANCTGTPVASITVGASYVVSGWFFSVDGRADVQPCVDWATSANAYISTGSTGGGFTLPSSRWTYLEQTLVAPATASRASVRIRMGTTPPASSILYAWGVRISRVKASWLYDTFTRTTASSWGVSDSGTTWNLVGGGSASDYLTNGTVAQHVLSTVDTTRRSAVTADYADGDVYCDMTTSAAATGDSLYGAIAMRMLDASNMYMARLEWTTGNVIILSVRKMVAGVQTQLGAFTTIFPHVAGTFVRVRFQCRGTTFKAKVWRVTDVEPDTWQITATDSAITAANQIGTRSVRITGNTNAATVNIQYDNFDVVNPQTFTVTRSQNRVVKAHSANASIQLAVPSVVPL